MTYRTPNQGKFLQLNKGDIFGNLGRTQNVDLKTSPGKLKFSSRLTLSTKDNDGGISNMGVPGAFAHMNGKYYAMCGIGAFAADGTGRLLVTASDSPSVAFANDAVANTPSNINADVSDMVRWQDGNYSAGSLGMSLFVSTFSSNTSQIKRLYQGTTWITTYFTGTVSGTFRSDGSCKNMCVGFNNNLYICDDDRIIYIPYPPYQSHIAAVLTNTSGTNNANNQAGTIDFVGRFRPIWIRSSSRYLWIGLMENYLGAGSGTKGYVAQWDTTGTAVNVLYDIDAPSALSCVIKDDVPYIIDAYGRLKKFTGTGFTEIARLPVANQNIEMPGIYNSLTNLRWIAHRGMELVDGKINIAVNNFVSTGVYVEDMPSGIWELNEDDPSAPFLYHKSAPCSASTDWGQTLLLTAGAIMATGRTTARFLAGFGYYTDDASTARKGIFYDNIGTDTNKRGLVTTPFLNSSTIKDIFKKIIYRFRPLQSGDKIIGKYRTAKKTNLPFIASVTWTSATTFTSTDTNFQYAVDGDEVEIMMGPGASSTVHISGIPSLSVATYTVIVDETLGFSSGSGKVKIENYIKCKTPLSDTNTSEGDFNLGNKGTRIQSKSEFRVTGGFELDDITIATESFKNTP